MKRHRASAFAIVVAALLALSACAAPLAAGTIVVPSGRPAKAALPAVTDARLSDAINGFGLDLLKVTSKGATGNTIISPLSVEAALSMTANGATGETQAQMLNVLHTTGLGSASNQDWANLLGGLGSRTSQQTLDIANAIWARKGIPFKQPFLDADRDFFGAQLSTLDFTKDDVAGAINGWVSNNTHGMITKMVDQVPSNAIMYLANAVYFKGDWVDPFDHNATQKQTFHRADGSTVDVQMMNAEEDLPYAENATLQATRLSYKGDDSAFYVMLPKDNVSLAAAMASLEGTGFSDLRAALSQETTKVVLGLPKLDTDFGTSLKAPLEALGMPLAFDPDHADFSGMAPPGLAYIGDVFHKTKVKVDEKGTVAAAATVVEMGATAIAEQVQPPQIICDRPYLIAIVDEKSGTMLFLGAVNDPTK
jgi:serine protease inhibitor